VKNLKARGYVAYMLKTLAFIVGIYFGFCGTLCCHGLSFTNPVKKCLTEPEKEARDGE
jgi:hypothetical protein